MLQRHSEGYLVLGAKRRGKPEDCLPIVATGEPAAPLPVRWFDGITWNVPHLLTQDYLDKKANKQANQLNDKYIIFSILRDMIFAASYLVRYLYKNRTQTSNCLYLCIPLVAHWWPSLE